MLHLVGLGLCDEQDITLRGLEVIRSCTRVFLEKYTAILMCARQSLETLYGKKVEIADRETVENGVDEILDAAISENVALLVVGDPFSATTHSDLLLRAKEKGVDVKVVHNASILTAVGACGLHLYRFGQNRELGLHTLCLLDIKVKEPSLEALARGKVVYEKPRYMTVNQAIEQLIEIEEKRDENVFSVSQTMCVGLARVGSNDAVIRAGTMQQLKDIDFGAPMHSLVICGDLHPMEAEVIKLFSV